MQVINSIADLRELARRARLLGIVAQLAEGEAVGGQRIDVADLEKSLAWFEKYGHRVVFFGRMIPAVRSLISIPAGMSNMPFRKFMAYSAAGTIIWTTFLAYIGYHFGENPALMSAITQRIGYMILAVAMLYILWCLIKKLYLSNK